MRNTVLLRLWIIVLSNQHLAYDAWKGFLQIKEDSPKWFYDRDDPDEAYTVSRPQPVYLLTTAQGSVLQTSDIYASLGEDTLTLQWPTGDVPNLPFTKHPYFDK